MTKEKTEIGQETTAKRFVHDFTQFDAQDEEHWEAVDALTALLAAAHAQGAHAAHRENQAGVQLMTDDKNEREHCEPTGPLVTAEELHCGKALYFVGPKHRKAVNVLVRERAAVRAECQAEIERLKAELNMTPLVRRVGATGIINDMRKARPDVLEFSRDGGKTWTR